MAKDEDYSGGPVGDHNRGGRGDSKSNSSRGGQGNNGPRVKPAVTMDEVKKRTEGRGKK